MRAGSPRRPAAGPAATGCRPSPCWTPSRGTGSTRCSAAPAGTGQSGEPAFAQPLRIVVSRSRPPSFAARVAQDIGATLMPLGSAGAKAAAVIAGDADAYLHDGGQYEWDSAAPVAVALATGLHASRLDGSKLEYNKADLWQPDILICPGKLADRLIAAVGIVRQSGSQENPPPPPVMPDQPESTRWP